MKKVTQYNEHYGRVVSDEEIAKLEEEVVAEVAPVPAVVVAMADAPEEVKAEADFVTDGVDDEVEISAAFAAATERVEAVEEEKPEPKKPAARKPEPKKPAARKPAAKKKK